MINLDDFSIEELDEFVTKAENKTFAEEIFPTKPQGFVRALNLLQKYAKEKIEAMKHRDKGRIDRAKRFEEKCGNIWRSLPDYAKWND
jgi:hypothetical protein